MKWIIEKDVFDDNAERLQKAIVDNGMEFEVVEYIPFQGGEYEFSPDCDLLLDEGTSLREFCAPKTMTIPISV